MNKKMTKRSVVIIIIAAFLIVYALLQVLPYPGFDGESKFKISEGEAPLIIAHGGAKHLWPENTIMSFTESFNMGVDVLETDLTLTSDDILITHHDLTIDKTSNNTGKVIEYTYNEISQMNFGYNFESLDGSMPYRDETDEDILSSVIPMTVEQLFETFGKDTMYIMEIKDGGEDGIRAVEILNNLVNEYGLQEYVCIASFHSEVMEHFVEIKDKNVDISMDFSTATNFVILNYLGVGIFASHEQAGLQLPTEELNIPLDNPYLIYKVHHNNMFIHYWTINDKETMRKLVDYGCDGIITDRPDLLMEVLEEAGY